jgi:predicted DNA-binding transcriptional regulator YafY
MNPLALEQRRVIIDYTNWKGERRERVIIPRTLFFGSTNFHPEVQWMMTAFDEEKQADRMYAMKNIHSWKGANETTSDRSQSL